MKTIVKKMTFVFPEAQHMVGAFVQGAFIEPVKNIMWKSKLLVSGQCSWNL